MLPSRHGRSESPTGSTACSATAGGKTQRKSRTNPVNGSTKVLKQPAEGQSRPVPREQRAQLPKHEVHRTPQQQHTKNPAKRHRTSTDIDDRAQKQQRLSARIGIANEPPVRQQAAAGWQSHGKQHSKVDRPQQAAERLAADASAAVQLPALLKAVDTAAPDDPARYTVYLPQLLRLVARANAQDAHAAAVAVADLASADAAAFRQSFVELPQLFTTTFLQAICTSKSNEASMELARVAEQWQTTLLEHDELLEVLCLPQQLQHLLQAAQHPTPAVRDFACHLAQSTFQAVGSAADGIRSCLEDSIRKLLTRIGSYREGQQAAVDAAEALAALSSTAAGIKEFLAAAPRMDSLWRVIQDGPAAVAAPALACAVNMAGRPGPASNLILPGVEKLLRRAAASNCPPLTTDGILKVLFVLAKDGATGLDAVGCQCKAVCDLLKIYQADLPRRSAAAAGMCAVLLALLVGEASGQAAAKPLEDKIRTTMISCSVVGHLLKVALAATQPTQPTAPSWLPLLLTAGNKNSTAAEAAMRLLAFMAELQPALMRTALSTVNQNTLDLLTAVRSSTSTVQEEALSAFRRVAACQKGSKKQTAAFWQAMSQQQCARVLLRMIAGRDGAAARLAGQEVLRCCLRQDAAAPGMLLVLVIDGMCNSAQHMSAEAVAATIAGGRFLYNQGNCQHLLPHAARLSELVQDMSCMNDARTGCRAACALMYLAGIALWFPTNPGVYTAAEHVLLFLGQFSSGTPVAVLDPAVLRMTATAACIFLSAVLRGHSESLKAASGSRDDVCTAAALLLQQLLSVDGSAALLHLAQQLADLPQQDDTQQPESQPTFQEAFSTLFAALPRPRPVHAAAAAMTVLKQLLETAPLNMCKLLLGCEDQHDDQRTLLELFLRTLGRSSGHNIMQQGRCLAIGLHEYAVAFKMHDLLGQLMKQAMVPSPTLQQGGQTCSEESGNAATVGSLICLASIATHSTAKQWEAVMAAAPDQLLMWLDEDLAVKRPAATAAACAVLRSLLQPAAVSANAEAEEASSPAGQARQNLLARLLTAERVAALLRLMQQDLQHANLDALTRLQTGNSPDLPANAVAAAGLILFSKLSVEEAEAPLAAILVESSHCLDLLFQCGGSQCDVISSMAIGLLMKLDALAGDGSPLHELWLEQLQQLQPHIMNAAIQQGSSRLAQMMIALGQQHAMFVDDDDVEIHS